MKVNVESYTRRLEEVHQNILTLQDNPDAANYESNLIALLNKSLPINSEEVIARHMFRKFMYNLTAICKLVSRSAHCYILLLNIPEIVQFYGIRIHISWDRTLKKYIPTEDINAPGFKSLPIYDGGNNTDSVTDQ